MNARTGRNDSAQPSRRPTVATGLERRNRPRWRRAFVTVIVAPLASSCVDAFDAFSDGPTTRPVKIEQLTNAVAARYTTPERSGRFEMARRRLVSGALVPSRAFADTTIWSIFVPPATRILAAHGALTDRGYRF